MKKDTVEMLHNVYTVLQKNDEIELLAELKHFVRNVKHTECLLTRGGIIQDVDGNLCVAGDEVYMELGNRKIRGRLQWIDNAFFVQDSTSLYRVISCNLVKAK